MMHGTYVGVKKLLRGEPAILGQHGERPNCYMAQFDNLDKLGAVHTHGWVAYPKSAFLVDVGRDLSEL